LKKINKILISSILGIALSSNLFASEDSFFKGKLYTKISYEYMVPENDTIMEIQPTNELIGDEMNILKLGTGFTIEDPGGIFNGSQFGLYTTYSNDYETDISVGIDFTLALDKLRFGGVFVPYIGGGAGLGWRNDSRTRKNVSTSVNKYNYVSTEDLNSLRTPTVAVFEDDTNYVQMGFSLGIMARVSDNVDFKAGYVYHKKTYEVAYRLENSPKILNSLDIDQRYNGFQTSLNIKF
jgi:opacity protein-like surface antigen